MVTSFFLRLSEPAVKAEEGRSGPFLQKAMDMALATCRANAPGLQAQWVMPGPYYTQSQEYHRNPVVNGEAKVAHVSFPRERNTVECDIWHVWCSGGRRTGT